MAEQNENQDAAPAKGGGMMGKLVIAGFMGVVIAAECAFAYLCIPSADDVKARNEAAAAAEAEAAEDKEGEENKDEEEIKVDEVDLEAYSLTSHQPASDTTLRLDFHLVGTVLSDEKADFDELYTRNKHRFREQVLFEMRNSEITDLTDPGLGLIKRRILEKSNALFGRPILQAVIFSDFSFVEQ